MIQTRIAAAVVPCWHGEPFVRNDEDFIHLVQGRFGEVLLHGYTHFRKTGGGLTSLMTGGADEFNGLSIAETHLRLRNGQSMMQKFFGVPACGFIAPTFQRGKLTADRLVNHGLHYMVGFRRIEFSNGRRIGVATWCWDMGRWRALGHAGYWYGHARMWLYRDLLPCLAIHPIDVDRGFMPQIVELVQSLVEGGRQPLLIKEIARLAR